MRVREFFNGGWAARHPWRAAALLAVLGAVAGWSFVRPGVWDTDILRLLPSDLPAVRGLARYQEGFSQSRELAFLLEWSGEAGAGGAVYERFLEALEGESWVERVLDGRSLGMSAGARSDARWLAALALNDAAGAPAGALEPGVLRGRLEELARRAAAGSPAALAALSSDPLGVWSAPAARAAQALDLEGVFELGAPDGSAWIVPVAVRMEGLGEGDCRELMEKVRGFLCRVAGEFPGGEVSVGVTGRAAYVTEVAAAMRRDFAVTSVISAALVLGIFWLGYRQLRLLPGIGLLLALAAGLSFACGLALLGSLNLVAASFCSILFGVGDDFSLLIVQRHAAGLAAGLAPRESAARAARAAAGGIRAVALTTALGFLALLWSGSPGFAQLGLMVALGVVFCAVLMPAFMPVFLVWARPAPGAEAVFGRWVGWVAGHRRGAGFLAGVVAVGSLLAAFAFPGRAGFDLSPRSLEPRQTPAARTLERMGEKFPAMFEPVMVVVPDPEPEKAKRLEAALNVLRAGGKIESFSSPAPLILDGKRMRGNRPEPALLRAARAAAAEAAGSLGLGEEFLERVDQQLAVLEAGIPEGAGWRDILPADSPWWFVVDRMLAGDGSAAVAYLRMPPGAGLPARVEVREALERAVPGVEVTGWSQMLAEMAPWAWRQLLVFGGGVLVVVMLTLGLVYRDLRDWAVHAAAMGLAAAGLYATLDILRVQVNLLNVLAFPLILGVGVDYGVHLLLAAREDGAGLEGTLRAVTFSGLTTAGGFGALIFAQNPALSGLGMLCFAGVLWCLAGAWLVVLPGCRFARGSLPRRGVPAMDDANGQGG